MKTRKFLSSAAVLFSVGYFLFLGTGHGADSLGEDPEEGAFPCDWLSVDGRLTDKTLSFEFRYAGPVALEKGAAYNVFLDTDRNPDTGFKGSSGEFPIGADYVIQGVTVFQYSGSGTDWSWNQLDALTHEIGTNQLTVRMDLEVLGNPEGAIEFICLGDNEAIGVDGIQTDVMPDGALINGDKLTLKPE